MTATTDFQGAIDSYAINAGMINGPGVLPLDLYNAFSETPDLIIPHEPNTVVFSREVRELQIPGWSP